MEPSLPLALASTSTQELTQHFVEAVEQIRDCHSLLVNHELANWSKFQRLFNFDKEQGTIDLNNMQQWYGVRYYGNYSMKVYLLNITV